VKPHVLLFDVMDAELRPFAERLFERGAALVMNDTPLRRALLTAGRPVRRWEEFEPGDLAARVEREMARIASGFAEALQTAEGRRAFDAAAGNVVAVAGRAIFESLLGMLARQVALIETFELLRGALEPRLVVLGCDNNHLERSLVGAARAAGVPSLQLAHGLNPRIRLRFAGEMHTVYADHVAVFGDRARRNLVADGNAPERVLVTGAPGWDALYRPEVRVERVEARRRLSLDPDRPVVLFLPSCWQGHSRVFGFNALRFAATTAALFRALRTSAPSAQLVIRPHPGERALTHLSPAELEAWIRSYEAWVRSEHGIDARVVLDRKTEVIRAADVALSPCGSSVIPEVMILERPIVLVRGWEGDDLYCEADGVLSVEAEDLAGALGRVLHDDALCDEMLARQARALPDLNYGHDGHAQDRVADLVLARLSLSARPPVQAVRATTRMRVTWHAQAGAGNALDLATAELLCARGVRLERVEGPLRNAASCDLLHVFGELPRGGPTRGGPPLLWSPLALPWPDEEWMGAALAAIFAEKESDAARAAYLLALADGSLEFEGRLRGAPSAGYRRAQAALCESLARVSHVCVETARAAQVLLQVAGVSDLRFSVVPPAAVPPALGEGPPAWAAHRYVLCSAAIEPRGNQLLLIEALHGLGLEVVLAGPERDADYAQTCRRSAGPLLLHAGPLPLGELAGARRAAECVAFPGFAGSVEPELLAAALARRPLVVSHDHALLEQLDDFPAYCDPCSVASIRTAVRSALHGSARRWNALGDVAIERFAPARRAAHLLAIYETLLGGGR
jgi:hypothetical protein